MNQLIVTAHPNPDSFTNALAGALMRGACEGGGQAVLRDLYAEGFISDLSLTDLELLAQRDASPDVAVEQKFILAADAIHFVYPLWWAGMPAKLKGYVDRVFTEGFAHGLNGETPLAGKRVMLWTPMGAPLEVYEKTGVLDAMGLCIDAAMFGYIGIEVLGHKYFPNMHVADLPTREGWLKEAYEAARRLAAAAV